MREGCDNVLFSADTRGKLQKVMLGKIQTVGQCLVGWSNTVVTATAVFAPSKAATARLQLVRHVMGNCNAQLHSQQNQSALHIELPLGLQAQAGRFGMQLILIRSILHTSTRAAEQSHGSETSAQRTCACVPSKIQLGRQCPPNDPTQHMIHHGDQPVLT